MLPADKRWAVGIIVGIAIFFSMVILAGRFYLTGIDDSFILRHSDKEIEGGLTLWMIRNDSKNIPLQIDPPLTDIGTYARGRIYIQREYIADTSLVKLQLRSSEPIVVSASSAPEGARLEIEVLHAKVTSHRPVIVLEPDPNMTRTTELYLDEIDPVKVSSQNIALDSKFTKSIVGKRYSVKIREDVFTFSGKDDLWGIKAYDSIRGLTEYFNGMALFKLRVRFIVSLAGGTEIGTDWMETQFFAVDLVESPI